MLASAVLSPLFAPRPTSLLAGKWYPDPVPAFPNADGEIGRLRQQLEQAQADAAAAQERARAEPAARSRAAEEGGARRAAPRSIALPLPGSLTAVNLGMWFSLAVASALRMRHGATAAATACLALGVAGCALALLELARPLLASVRR